ncbi:hypothetical protein [Frankia sp. EAN1pec]|uniref:hypothetical protein n=1 Tax=Parafrankia sp. (strain EAN1pec) TaxID=298653 RepID=UPI0000542DE8
MYTLVPTSAVAFACLTALLSGCGSSSSEPAAGGEPRRWGNPVQPGTLTPTSGTEVVFTDDAGHRVAFALRPDATAWKRLCD